MRRSGACRLNGVYSTLGVGLGGRGSLKMNLLCFCKVKVVDKVSSPYLLINPFKGLTA